MKKIKNIQFTNCLSKDERIRIKSVIESTELNKRKINSQVDSLQLWLAAAMVMICMVILYVVFQLRGQSATKSVICLSSVVIGALAYRVMLSETICRTITMKSLHISSKQLKEDEERCLWYAIQLDIESYLDELANKSYMPITEEISIQGNTVNIERKYANKISGTVYGHTYSWTMIDIEENIQVDVPTLDVQNLLLKLPLKKIND